MNYVIDGGRLTPAREVSTSNFGPRPVGSEIDLLVIHNISLPPGQFEGECIEQFFCNTLDCDAHPYFDQLRGVEVSAHLLIRRDGEVVQFVNFDERAWHAGRSSFMGREECNDYSIGVELEGDDDTAYDERQYRALAGITRALMREYPSLNLDRITGHSDIAPGRKTDPGPSFDWQVYRAELEKTGENG